MPLEACWLWAIHAAAPTAAAATVPTMTRFSVLLVTTTRRPSSSPSLPGPPLGCFYRPEIRQKMTFFQRGQAPNAGQIIAPLWPNWIGGRVPADHKGTLGQFFPYYIFSSQASTLPLPLTSISPRASKANCSLSFS